MLRFFVLLLLIANVAFFGWRHGWMGDNLPAGDDRQRDPTRLELQVHPERVEILATMTSTSSAAAPRASSALPGVVASSTASSPAPVESVCLEAGPFDATELQRLQALWAAVLPASSWQAQLVDVPGLWLVYMGPYPDPAMLQRKQQELRRIRNLSFEEVRSPASLASGLSLGRYTSAAQADAALESMRLRGIRTARVVSVRPPISVTVVRAPAVDPAQRQRLASLALPAGKAFTACQPPAAP